ncbi:MAG TPA: hypothetical protein VED59_00720 [Acidimicrobiales bacterium]|nr:hypothetical protein [Acidimicrobiales bacterium]
MEAIGEEALAGICSKLEVIAEELADLGMAKLREAIETGSVDAAALERRIGRARRAVEKAGALLLGGGDEG